MILASKWLTNCLYCDVSMYRTRVEPWALTICIKIPPEVDKLIIHPAPQVTLPMGVRNKVFSIAFYIEYNIGKKLSQGGHVEGHQSGTVIFLAVYSEKLLLRTIHG